MTDDRKATTPGASGQQNEGEGSRTAAEAYDREARRFAQSGKVEEKAKEARDAVEGPEGEELAAAEAQGRRHSKGEDPEVKRKS